MPNRQRTMHSFYTAPGARVQTVPAPMPAQATAPEPTAPGPSRADELGRTITDDTEQHAAASAANQSAATATPAQDRCHNLAGVPTPWGVAPLRNALRGVITCHDSDGRCSYAASHKCHSAAITGLVVLSSITPTSLCSGKTPLSSTPPRVDEHHW